MIGKPLSARDSRGYHNRVCCWAEFLSIKENLENRIENLEIRVTT